MRVYGVAVTPKCLGGPPVNRNRLNAPPWTKKFDERSKNIVDADSGNESEMNSASRFPTSSKLRNLVQRSPERINRFHIEVYGESMIG
ncbi:hypothetical protein TNCV_1903621 [Trichonephila clavipes]|nr:hypothetical protein TNCV_1903621 [Trichonephila clavipes]